MSKLLLLRNSHFYCRQWFPRPLLPATLPEFLVAMKSVERAYSLEPSYAMYTAAVAEQHLCLGRWVTALDLSGQGIHSFRVVGYFSNKGSTNGEVGK